MRDDLPMIVTLNAQSAPLSASSDGQVFAVNQTQNRFRAFARRLSFQPDAKYIRARCGPMKEHMLDPGGNAKIDDVLAKEWKERVGTPRRGRMAIGYDITFSRVGGAEPPTRRAFDVLSPSNVRHGRGFVVEPTGWLLPNADLGLIAAATQAVFTEQIISRAWRLEWLRSNCERIFEEVRQSFSSGAAGDQFRAAIGTTTLRSTAFSVDTEGANVRFTGRGYGHGVGMCQWGAVGRARAGQDAGTILRTYFPGADVARWY